MEAILNWIMQRPWTTAGLVLAALIGVVTLATLMARPRLDRDWEPHLAHMPSIELRDDGFTLGPATDWSYNAAGPIGRGYTTASETFADLRNVWFVVEPHPGMKPMAHTLILFEFAGDRIIGLTVEARRESTEEYSALWGLFNRFELAFVWSTARDLLARRAVFLAHDILVYPLDLTEEQKVAYLRSVLEKTKAVSSVPRFYNTLTSNCTNELAKAAGIGWHYSWVLTGYSPERLFELKMIPGATLEEARAKALVSDKVRSWSELSAEDFDRALLAELRRRNAPRLEAVAN